MKSNPERIPLAFIRNLSKKLAVLMLAFLFISQPVLVAYADDAGVQNNSDTTVSDTSSNQPVASDAANQSTNSTGAQPQTTANAWANSRPVYTDQQIQSLGYSSLPYYYRQSGDPQNTVRINQQRIQELGNLAGQLSFIIAGDGVTKSSSEIKYAFSQSTVSPFFNSAGPYAGNTLASFIEGLKNGTISPKDLPIYYIERNGVRIVDNNRSAYVLQKAGVPSTDWVWRSADERSAQSILAKLQRNSLGTSGTGSVNLTTGKSNN